MSTLLPLINTTLLLNVLMQVSVLAALALLVLAFIKRRPAWRYAIAYSAVAGIALLVVVSIALQSLPRAWVVMPLTLPDIQLIHSKLVLQPQQGTAVPFELTQPSPGALDIPVAGDPSKREIFSSFVIEAELLPLIINLLLLMWVLGAIVALARLLCAAIGLRQLVKRARAPQAEQHVRIINVLQQLGFESSAVKVQVSTDTHSPVQTGFAQACILLPRTFLTTCTSAQLEAVLIHELAHWQRRDTLANLLQKLVLSLFWFHPLLHLLDRIASQAREEICDNHVLLKHSALDYSEILFGIYAQCEIERTPTNTENNLLATEIMGSRWNLEQRIRELIDKKRETAMQLSNKATISVRLTSIGLSLLLATVVLAPGIGTINAQPPQSQTRNAPPTNDAEVLGAEVFAAITQIQQVMAPDTDEVEPDLAAAKELLDTLYDEQFETANTFEKATILNFYTNYYLSITDYPGALRRFEQIVALDGVRQDVRLRALRSLGQLYAAEEQWQQSIDAYVQWQSLTSNTTDRVVYRGLSYDYYQLAQWQDSLDNWRSYFDLKDNSDLNRDDYAFLNGLYYTLGMYDDALVLTKEMILRFNQQTDWDNLIAINKALEDASTVAELGSELGGTLTVNVPEPEIAFAAVVPSDADYLPLIAVAPMYPRAAAEGGIEGWVLIKFTVNARGSVDQQSIQVEDAEPAMVFDNSAIRAASQFKFMPRMTAGEAVAVNDVQYLFRYAL